MDLSKFIEKSLVELDKSFITGQVDFDIAVMPFDNKIWVIRESGDFVSHIRFTVSMESKSTKKEQPYA